MRFDQKNHQNNVSYVPLEKNAERSSLCGLLQHIKISIFKIPINLLRDHALQISAQNSLNHPL